MKHIMDQNNFSQLLTGLVLALKLLDKIQSTKSSLTDQKLARSGPFWSSYFPKVPTPICSGDSCCCTSYQRRCTKPKDLSKVAVHLNPSNSTSRSVFESPRYCLQITHPHSRSLQDGRDPRC